MFVWNCAHWNDVKNGAVVAVGKYEIVRKRFTIQTIHRKFHIGFHKKHMELREDTSWLPYNVILSSDVHIEAMKWKLIIFNLLPVKYARNSIEFVL